MSKEVDLSLPPKMVSAIDKCDPISFGSLKDLCAPVLRKSRRELGNISGRAPVILMAQFVSMAKTKHPVLREECELDMKSYKQISRHIDQAISNKKRQIKEDEIL